MADEYCGLLSREELLMDVKVLGISGSPRKGATDFAVNHALEYAGDKFGAHTEYFSLRAKNINFCIHCDYCVRKKKGCIHNDDMEVLYPLMQEAKIWIVGSPVYHGHLSAQTKAVLDRTRALMAKDRDVFSMKMGMGIAVAGDRNGGQEQVLKALTDFYIINKMSPVGGGVFGANFGGTIWSGDRGKSGAEEDQEGKKSIYKTLDRVFNLLQGV